MPVASVATPVEVIEDPVSVVTVSLETMTTLFDVSINIPSLVNPTLEVVSVKIEASDPGVPVIFTIAVMVQVFEPAMDRVVGAAPQSFDPSNNQHRPCRGR